MFFSDHVSHPDILPFQQQALEALPIGLISVKSKSFKAIWENQSLAPISKLILLSFAQRCSAQDIFKDKITLSLKTLCEEASSSHQTIVTHLQQLKEDGYLSIDALSHKKRVYSLTEKLFCEYKAVLLSQGLDPVAVSQKQFEGGEIPSLLSNIKGISSSQKILILWLAGKCKNSKFLIPQTHRQEEMSLQINLSKNSLTRAVRRALLHKEKSSIFLE